MKNLFCLICILFFNLKAFAQDNFEGIITFKTDITVTKTAPKDLSLKLNYKYGDSLQMFYTKEGNFRRKYINSGEYGGIDTQTYNTEEGKLIIKIKDRVDVQSSDVSVNSLKLISFKQIENEFLMNLDCECYEYIGKAQNNKKVVLQFCFSNLINKINVKAFDKYNDFFIKDYFTKTERPYLKYTMIVDDFTLKFTAVKILKSDLKKIKN